MKKISTFLLIMGLSLFALTGCGAKKDSTNIPFSDFEWNATQEEIEKTNGVSAEAYDGIYGGKALVYDKQYQGLPGQVIYMFNTDGKLADIAWKTVNESDETLTNLLDKVSSELTKTYGEKTFDNTAATAVGGKWEDGNIHILVNKVDLGGTYVLQIAYLNQETAQLGYLDNSEQ